MLSISGMSLILCVIMLFVGAFSVIRVINGEIRNGIYACRNLPIIDAVVLIMYLCAYVYVCLLYFSSGRNPMVIYVVLALYLLASGIAFLRFGLRHIDTMRVLPIILFTAYMLVVLYLTLFMRINHGYLVIRSVPFDDILSYFRDGDPKMVIHAFKNMLLFIPYGILFPAMNPKYLAKWSVLFVSVLTTTSVIEGSQMVFRLGDCDIDDLISNVIGALIGFALFKLFEKQKEQQ